MYPRGASNQNQYGSRDPRQGPGGNQGLPMNQGVPMNQGMPMNQGIPMNQGMNPQMNYQMNYSNNHQANPGNNPGQRMNPGGQKLHYPQYPQQNRPPVGQPMGQPMGQMKGGMPQQHPQQLSVQIPRQNLSPVSHGIHAVHGIGSPKSNHSSDPAQLRKIEAEKIIADCYSKLIVDKGRQVPDVTYQTHIAIKEFSSFPSTPPPDNLPLNQVGSVKPRVLVICIKHSGRALIQKGKFNDAKSMYQIGRTWDMDELKGITKVGNNGLIISLNKDYYWKVEEGTERIWKFSRYLTSAYAGFTGRYPILNGFTITDFKLPPVAAKKAINQSPNPNSNSTSTTDEIVLNQPSLDPQLVKSRSLKRQNLPNPVLPPQPTNLPAVPSLSVAKISPKIPIIPIVAPISASIPLASKQKQAHAGDLYKDMDFTANGKLPMKQMNIISDRRVSDKIEPVKFQPLQSNRSSDQADHADLSSTDSHSFVFAKQPEEKKPLRTTPKNFQHQPIARLSDEFASTASLSLQLESQLGASSPKSSHKSQSDAVHSNYSDAASADIIKEFSDSLPRPSKLQTDFGIEEITDDSESEIAPTPIISIKKRTSKPNRSSSPEILDESTKMYADPFHTSMQEIEALLDNQIGLGSAVTQESFEFNDSSDPRKIDAPVINNPKLMDHFVAPPDLSEPHADNSTISSADETTDHSDFHGQALDEDEAMFTGHQPEQALNINKKKQFKEIILEKDPEIEEMLEDIHWSLTDSGESIIKKLNAELTLVKQRNIKELISLDFSKKNIVSNDMKVSMAEIENLTRVFKKMEVDFKFLSTDVNEIENNSQGIQVKAINKKLLYKDLKDILDKVNVNSEDLNYIQSFKEFDRLNKLDGLEIKLQGLSDALDTIRHDTDNDGDNLSDMKALQQYQANYEKVTSRFIGNFSAFIKAQLSSGIRQLSSNLGAFRASLLFRELSELLIYSGIMYFVKEVGVAQYSDLNQYFNITLGDFLERVFKEQLRHIKFTTASAMDSGPVTPTSPLKKSRTIRLTRKMSKLGGLTDESELEQQRQQHVESVKKYAAANTSRNEIDDPRVVIDIIDETKDLVLLVQYFTGTFFHFDNRASNYNEFVKNFPYKHRRQLLDELPDMQIEKLNSEMTYSSNELISNMTTIFGNFINTNLKSINPSELNLPLILIYLETMLNEQQKTSNHEYLVFNYLKKSIDKYKNSWNKFIKTQLDSLNKALINAKCGILPSIKNINQLMLITESSIDHNRNIARTDVRDMIDNSYKDITESLIHLFMRDDPLLKNHDFDDKEREYRNVSILQNIFYIVEQLSQFTVPSAVKMKQQLQSVFKKVQDAYFQRQLSKTIGKLVDFVVNYETLIKGGKPKKYNKKYMKSLLSSYTAKDITLKAQEIYKRLEKHFLTGSDMFEKDLVDKLWLDMENEFADYFGRLNNILTKHIELDLEYSVSKQELHKIFKDIH